MHARRSIYLTFGQWGVQAALDISNFRPLKVNYNQELYSTFNRDFYRLYIVQAGCGRSIQPPA